MKAKHFKNLRSKAKYYEVQVTEGLFGSFWDHKEFYIILAKTPRQACIRAKRRGIGLGYSISFDGCSERWGHFRVKLKGKNNHWKNFWYY